LRQTSETLGDIMRSDHKSMFAVFFCLISRLYHSVYYVFGFLL